MFQQPHHDKADLVRELSDQGYRSALAAGHLAEGRYSQAVEICKEHLREEPQSISVRLIYARALHGSGQVKLAEEEFYRILSADPDNVVALKHLGDIRFADGDEVAARANYARVLEIDPYCKGLKSDLSARENQPTRTITLRPEAAPADRKPAPAPRRKIYFYTETIGDLYLAQGHALLAVEVFRTLYERNQDPRLAVKLAQAEGKTKEKEKQDVS